VYKHIQEVVSPYRVGHRIQVKGCDLRPLTLGSQDQFKSDDTFWTVYVARIK